jgi:hypothetical protein
LEHSTVRHNIWHITKHLLFQGNDAIYDTNYEHVESAFFLYIHNRFSDSILNPVVWPEVQWLEFYLWFAKTCDIYYMAMRLPHMD